MTNNTREREGGREWEKKWKTNLEKNGEEWKAEREGEGKEGREKKRKQEKMCNSTR